MSRYSFEITDGPDEGRTFQLQPGITLIGRRDSPADDDPSGSSRWILTDPAVSRTHARIDWDGKKLPVLLHLSSTNATLLEGRIVTGQSIEDGQSLSDGHKLRMGQTGMVVKAEEDDQGRWYVVDRLDSDTEYALEPGGELTFGGVQLSCGGIHAEASLVDESAEAYVLRQMEEQFWTTALKPGRTIVLKGTDIVRTESNKLVLEERSPNN